MNEMRGLRGNRIDSQRIYTYMTGTPKGRWTMWMENQYQRELAICVTMPLFFNTSEYASRHFHMSATASPDDIRIGWSGNSGKVEAANSQKYGRGSEMFPVSPGSKWWTEHANLIIYSPRMLAKQTENNFESITTYLPVEWVRHWALLDCRKTPMTNHSGTTY